MRLAGAGRAREILPKNSRSTFLSIIEPNKLRRFGPRRSLPFNLAWRKSRNGGSNRRSWASRVRIGLTAGAKEIRTAGPILVFIGSRRPVRDEYRRHRARRRRCIRRRSASRPSGVNIAAIRTALRRCRQLVLNDHAYDKLTGWSNVIPVVPVKGDATETYKFVKEESHGTRSTPHRHRT